MKDKQKHLDGMRGKQYMDSIGLVESCGKLSGEVLAYYVPWFRFSVTWWSSNTLIDFMIMKFKPIRSTYTLEYSGVPRIP